MPTQNGLGNDRRSGSGENLEMVGRTTSKCTIYLSNYHCTKGQNCGGTEELVFDGRDLRVAEVIKNRESERVGHRLTQAIATIYIPGLGRRFGQIASPYRNSAGRQP